MVAFVVSFGLVDLLGADPQDATAALRTPPAVFLSAVGGYLLIAAAMAWLNTRLSLRRLSSQEGLPPRALRRHHLLAVATGVWLAAGLAGVLLTGYGRWLVEDLHLSGVPLVPKLLAVAPFLAALEFVWLLDYPYYRAVRRRIWAGRDDAPCWSPAEYLDYNTRHHVLFIAVPVSLIVLGVDLLALGAPVLDRALPAPAGQMVQAAGSFAVAGAVFLLSPLLIVRVWRTERLPDGPLRARLQDTCARLGLHVRDLRVWRSGGQIVNAAVMGLAAPVRYVLLTDALLEYLDERGVEAVFAHEAGHIV
ncbi:MAG TPA: hypothetical protein DCX07_04890, partial [Phycisphaerales bacterium]|nr:hypothetical protein [Phycisphaerales bacterium]